MRTVIIGQDPIPVPNFDPNALSVEECKRLKRLLEWEYNSSEKTYFLTRRYAHKVGRVVLKNLVFSIVPDMAAHDFTIFFLYSLGVRLERFSAHQSSAITAAYGDSHQDFRTLAATLLILTAEDLAAGYLAKGYITKRERINTVRGRIDWNEFSRPGRRTGVPCIFSEISLDNLLNRIIVAGLYAVKDVPVLPAYRRRLNEQLFTWSSIAAFQHIQLSDLQLAEKSLNRLTGKYQSIIGLCRMVMFGYSPNDFFSDGESDFQCIEFDLARIFERFVLRLIQQHLEGTPLSVESQVRERDGLRDGYGNTYHETRPDFVITFDSVPIAVLDAKFKPRYVSQKDNRFLTKNKVSEADVYQLLFYAQRASQLAGGSKVPAFIVSPYVDSKATVPNSFVRKINWVHDGKLDVTIDVVDINMPATIAAIKCQGNLPEDGLASVCHALLQQHSAGEGKRVPPSNMVLYSSTTSTHVGHVVEPLHYPIAAEERTDYQA